jgi:hypothetical protein
LNVKHYLPADLAESLPVRTRGGSHPGARKNEFLDAGPKVYNAMSDHRDDAIKELQAAVIQDTQTIADLSMRIETIRALLHQRGVFSHAEHQQMHTLRLQQWNDFVQARLPVAVDAKKHAVLRRLFEEFQGKSQQADPA